MVFFLPMETTASQPTRERICNAAKGWKICARIGVDKGAIHGEGARAGERKDETPRPDRAERRRNGLAKLVPTLKPRNGLNDSWRVGGCGHSVPVSTPSPVGETSSAFFFLFSRDVPFAASVLLGGLSRALSKEEEGSWQAARKKDPSFLPSFRNYPRVILHEN